MQMLLVKMVMMMERFDFCFTLFFEQFCCLVFFFFYSLGFVIFWCDLTVHVLL